MGRGLVLPWFALVVLVSFLSSAAAAAAVGGRKAGEGLTARPGFLYTRSRGRCTPQYWSDRREAWPKMVPQTSSVAKVFGSRALERYEPTLTLWEATEKNDGSNAFSRLLKQSSAALLNAYAQRTDFPYSAWEVKTLLIQALVSEDAAALQAERFAKANQACT